MAHDIYDSIFDEFCKMCPWAAKDVKKWYPSENEMEITIEMWMEAQCNMIMF